MVWAVFVAMGRWREAACGGGRCGGWLFYRWDLRRRAVWIWRELFGGARDVLGRGEIDNEKFG